MRGRFSLDVIGVDPNQGAQMDRGKVVAIRGMKEQAPAYRARPRAWPTEEADGGGCGNYDGDAVLSPAPAALKLPVGVRILKAKGDRMLSRVSSAGERPPPPMFVRVGSFRAR